MGSSTTKPLPCCTPSRLHQPTSTGASATAARSNQPYPPAATDGGLPIVTMPSSVSRGIQRHTPHAVPSTSSQVTTMKAPT